MSINDDMVVDPLDQAIYDTVHGFENPKTGKKGALGLAPAVGMNASTLQNKANPTNELQYLGLKEARQLMLATGDHRMLHQLANDVGMTVVPLPTLEVVGDLQVLEALTEWQAEVGETAQKVRDIYKDGRVEMREVLGLEKELVEDFEKGMALLRRVRAQAEPEEKSLKVVK